MDVESTQETDETAKERENRGFGDFEGSRRKEKGGEEMKWERGLNSLIFAVTVDTVDKSFKTVDSRLSIDLVDCRQEI